MTSHDSYRAIHEGAAIGAVAPRGQIAIAGTDRASYLQGLLTNDIPALTAGSGCYSAWLTPQGRLITDMHVLESGAMILLDVPEAQLESIMQRLDQFLFGEDVQFQSLAGSLTGVWIHGPESPAVLETVLRRGESGDGTPFAAWPEYHHAQIGFGDAPVVVARISQLGVPGFCVYLDPAREASLVEALRQAGVQVADAATIDAARVEAGYPVFGIDMTEETLPLEAEIQDRAISFTKGCYVGQEVVIRVLHRGGGRVAKKLVGLRVAGQGAVRGARLFAAAKDIGFVTSVAESPRFGPIALGYVHRDFVAPGTAIEVAASPDAESESAASARLPATVTARPMSSDV